MTNNGMLLPVLAYSQSSYEGHEAGKAFDHNRGTSWKAGPYYQWIMADLQRNCSVSSLQLKFAPIKGYYHYHIEYSSDRMNWFLLTEKYYDAPEKP